MEELHETHAALHQPSGGEAFFAEGLGVVLVGAVERMYVFGFARQVHYLRHGGLHLKGQLVGLDARAQSRIGRVLFAGKPVEFAEQAEVFALFL